MFQIFQVNEMRSTYFIADFSYDPDATEPLKVFELGDAFSSSLPDKKIYDGRISANELFWEDLRKQYPSALLLQVYPSGLNILDLSNQHAILSYDKNNMFDDSVYHLAPSHPTIEKLIFEVLKNAEKRTQTSRLLLLYLGHPKLFMSYDFQYNLPIYKHIKLVNNLSQTMTSAFYDKNVFYKFASDSPIYPKTLKLYCSDSDIEEKVTSFVNKTQADYYVIKPAQGTRSEGVHITSQTELLATIRKIQGDESPHEACDIFRSRNLLIQVCHLSKLIEYDRKHYFAKGRIIMRADFEDGHTMPTLAFLAGYWHCCKEPFHGDMNDETGISNPAGNPDGILKIEEADWKAITLLFSQHMAPILQSMCINDSQSNIDNNMPWFNGPYSFEEYKSSASTYKEVFKQFFKQQVLIPTDHTLAQKAFFWWNTYVESSRSQSITKKFIIDFLGIDQSFKKKIDYNCQPIDGFVEDHTTTLFDNKTERLNQGLSFKNKAKHEAIAFLLCLLVDLQINFILDGNISPRYFPVSLLVALTSRLVMKSISYMNDNVASPKETSRLFKAHKESRRKVSSNLEIANNRC